jgi:hypothetical protein
MKKIKSIIVSVMMMLGVITLPVAPVFAEACTDSPAQCAQNGTDSVNNQGSNGGTKLEDMIKIIVNVLLFLLGAIAVIMIIIGGIRYATSGGDASATKSAKDTILYAVIGLVVAILAYAIVNFILGAFK